MFHISIEPGENGICGSYNVKIETSFCFDSEKELKEVEKKLIKIIRFMEALQW